MNEQLSAFLDGEATRDETDIVVNGLLRDDALRDSWSRQHWIRTTLRAHSSEIAVDLDTDFSQRVMAAIADDEHVETVPSAAIVEPMRVSRARPSRWRGMAGVGMAAAVAGVVLMSGNPFSRSTTGSESRIATTGSKTATTRNSRESERTRVAASNTTGGLASNGWDDRLADFSTVSAPPTDAMRRAVTGGMVSANGAQGGARSMAAGARVGNANHWSVSDPAVREELNGYLADHSGMARGYGMSSTTPGYVRVATYGQGATQ